MGVIWHGDFISGVEKSLHMVECLLTNSSYPIPNTYISHLLANFSALTQYDEGDSRTELFWLRKGRVVRPALKDLPVVLGRCPELDRTAHLLAAVRRLTELGAVRLLHLTRLDPSK
jgi:hypothetical protein